MGKGEMGQKNTSTLCICSAEYSQKFVFQTMFPRKDGVFLIEGMYSIT